MRARAFALLSFLSFYLSLSHSALACSVCGCDPSSGALGLDRPGARTLRVILEDRMLSKESGSGDGAESERENRSLLRLQYSPLPRLTLQADAPVFLWKRHLDSTGAQDDNGHGLGDAGLAARYEFLRLGGLVPAHVFAVTGGVKLPTGRNDNHLPGAAPDEHLQLGTGTFDTTLGLSYTYGDLPWALFASASARLNGTNSRGFQSGNALFGSIGVRRNFLGSQRLLVSLEAQLRSAGKDRIGSSDGAPGYDDDSGGQIYYGTASVAYAITDALFARGTMQVPIVTSLNGTQGEHPVGYLTFAYDFSL